MYFIHETFATSTVNNREYNAIHRTGIAYKEHQISGIMWRSVFCAHSIPLIPDTWPGV